MRLHRLEITAFGPFSGTEVIDFDGLSGAGLFLIHGQTGAGKTSVLDAVCFALYGQVPGLRNAVKRLRSDHAPPELGPRVTLEATIKGRRLRITRSPEWERPKLRGSGTTVDKARVILTELRPAPVGAAVSGDLGAGRSGEVALSTRLDEAGDLVTGLLGMNAGQFCQVAMLPQGEFAAFLRAGAEQRRKVLEKLFGTEVFTHVEAWLTDRRAAARREAEGLWAAVESVADRIAEVAGTDRPWGTAGAGSAGGAEGTTFADDDTMTGHELVRPWAAELAGQLVAVREQSELSLATADDGQRRARAAAEHGTAVADRRRRHAEAVRQEASLRERAGERAGLAARVEAAERAGRVLPLAQAAGAAERRAEEATAEALVARDRVGGLVPAQAPADVLDKAERERRADIAGLERLRDDATRLERVTQEIGRCRTEGAALEEREAESSAAVVELPELVGSLRATLEELRIKVAGRDGAVAAAQEASRVLDAAVQRDRLAGAVTAAEDAQRVAVDEAQRARDRLQELRQRRLDGMAAELAAGLVTGEPCRVCGSTEHPAPAAGDGAVPADLREREAAAESAYELAQTAREQAAVRVEGLRAELDAAYEIAGEREPDDSAAALTAARETIAEIDAASLDLERHEADLLRREAELSGARDRLEEVRRALTETTTRLTELTAERGRLRLRLDEARGDDPTIQDRIERLTAEAHVLAVAAQASRQAEVAGQEAAAARAAAETAAAREGFGDLDMAGAAALNEGERALLLRRAREFDDQVAAVRATLADPELVAAAAEADPDVPALRAALADAEATADRVRSVVDRARSRCARLAELRAALDAQVAEWRPAAARHTTAHRLAGVVSGRPAVNRLSMPLSSYVLAARLEQVVVAANERLGRMSAGRYALVHTVDRAAADGRRRSATGGLGLRISDAWTGHDRDPATLSGGESFIAALALALGLADVVTAEAGGTEIGTLFVDEGFGTLDEETLDEVMDVLDGLRDGGRVVGIVSHVAELRSRIPAQLRVRKDRAGSRAVITTPQAEVPPQGGGTPVTT